MASPINFPNASDYAKMLQIPKIAFRDDNLKTLPVLMVTAEAKREQIVEAAQCGVNGYIVKPFTAQTLEEKIGKIFERIG